jgi:hypothetical protein
MKPNELAVLEQIAAENCDQGEITEVIRPAAVLPTEAAHSVLTALSERDVAVGGVWQSTATQWRRFDQPSQLPGVAPPEHRLVGTIQIVYGAPTRHDITNYRVTVTAYGHAIGWAVESLCDDAIGHAGYTLATCPRASLTPPPRPFRFPSQALPVD